MKKFFAIFITIIMVFSLVSCGGGNGGDEEETVPPEETIEEEVSPEDEGISPTESNTQTYKIGETWTVDGEWNFTVDSAEITDERSPYFDENPEYVALIKYHYDNLGYKDPDGLLDGLLIMPMVVTDDEGNNLDWYLIGEAPEEISEGESTEGSSGYILKKGSGPLYFTIQQFDSNNNPHEANFEIDL